MARRTGAVSIVALLVVGALANYWLYGPLASLVMAGLEFTLIVFVMLAVILVRHRHDQ